MGLTTPNTHAPRAKANRPVLLVECARSTHRGFRVGVLDSFAESLVWGVKSWIRHPAARPTRHGALVPGGAAVHPDSQHALANRG
jgi:hypothetical protein